MHHHRHPSQSRRGRGRPRTLDRRRQIRLPVEMDEALEAKAAETGLTVSDLIRQAVTSAFFMPQTVSITPQSETVVPNGTH